MASSILAPVELGESELLFTEMETREILKFFWPAFTSSIATIVISNATRAFAQSLLMLAIDASNTMGFVQVLGTTVVKPTKSIKALTEKLAKRFVKRWWKNTHQKDLLNAKIYESIRRDISWYYRSMLEERLNGIASRTLRGRPFFAGQTKKSGAVWV